MILLSVVVTAALLPAAPASAHAGTTYYVDSKGGRDSASGTSALNPWKTLAKVNAADLKPGDAISLKRGSAWIGTLALAADGTAARPIVVQPYGEGAMPVISGARAGCVVVGGDHWRISGLRASRCGWSGFELRGTGGRLTGVRADGNIAGVLVTPSGSHNVVSGSTLAGNDRMSVNDEGGDDDSGAFGVLLNGDDNVITGNTITGSFATSHDYGVDGAAVEVFNGDRNRITHNIARDNETFSELGAEKGKTATGNVFAFNVVTSSRTRGAFLVTRGSRHVVGPVLGTLVVNNSVHLPGRRTIGWVCTDGCSPSILRLRNNAIDVGGVSGEEDGEGADEAGGVYKARTTHFKLGPRSVKADPKFVSRTDLRLRPGSPARGRGLPLDAHWYGGAAFARDIAGKRLPAAPSAGAYQD